MLEDRITKISTKPLPTQEQIDWNLTIRLISQKLWNKEVLKNIKSTMLRKRLLEKR